MDKKRDISAEFSDILTAKDCGRYSKSAKDNYSDALTKLSYTLKDLVSKYDGSDPYAKHMPDIDKSVVDFYEDFIKYCQDALKNYVKKGVWDFNATSFKSKYPKKTIEMFDAFMDKSHSTYFKGTPELVENSLNKTIKTLTKNGFSASNLEDAKKAEEEAKKPKMPDKIEFERMESYDSKKMQDYKANSRGESMAQSAFLTKRARQFNYAKHYENQVPGATEYVKELFLAFDNAWFSYVSGRKPNLDFSEVDAVYKKWTTSNPKIASFDGKVCGQRLYSGGSCTVWDCKDSLNKMANNREKTIKTITMEKEDTYSLWEKSVDSILNEEGKPSLNAYLDNWVEEVVAFYTNPDNIKRWKSIDVKLKKEISDLEDKAKAIAKKWSEDHRNDREGSWKYIRDGYQSTEEYEKISWSIKAKKSTKASNDKELSIVNLGKTKIREMFKQQAADAKKSFVTAVCERAGVLQSGVFYWSEQNTGHLNGTVVGENGSKWRITSFFAGGYNIQRLHCRTKITQLVK